MNGDDDDNDNDNSSWSQNAKLGCVKPKFGVLQLRTATARESSLYLLVLMNLVGL